VENKTWKFPAGEIGLEFHIDKNHEIPVDLFLREATADAILTVLMQANAVWHQDRYRQVRLFCPYVPYGRQDRVSSPGTAFSLEVFAELFAKANVDEIHIVDPHSKETVYQLEVYMDVFVYPANKVFSQRVTENMNYDSWKNVVVLAPDKGAVERAWLVADSINCTQVHYAQKVRDPESGEILGIEALTIEPHHHVLVVDDICDGGKTFIELAKAIEGRCASKTLYVTHGIFSKGYGVVADHYDAVWCTDSFKNDAPANRIIPLNKHFNW
jgi:ribose-phosphate pyrophosphokinase